MRRNRLYHIAACLLVLVVGRVYADQEQDLISILRSDAGAAQKWDACFKLRMVGTAKSVPALAALLGEERLSHAARNALEGMPCAEAGKALRQALGASSGTIKVGLIDSLGWRREREAVELLGPLLSDTDAAIASAAASALGRIGGKEAMQALEKALQDQQGVLREAVADAYLEGADVLRRGQNSRQASFMYRTVLHSDLPGHMRGAALMGLAQCGPVAQELISAFQSDDAQMPIAAAHVVRETAGEPTLRGLVVALPGLPTDAQTLLIRALAARRAGGTLRAVTTACKSDDDRVRLAALEALGALGNADSVAILLGAATEGTEAEQGAARGSLETLQGEGVDEALISRMNNADERETVEIVQALTSRDATDAVPTLLRTAGSESRDVRAAAVDGLGELAGQENIPALVDLLAKADAGDRRGVRKMLVAVARRCQAGEPVSRELVTKLDAVEDDETRASFLLALGELGDDSGLPALRQAVKNPSDAIKRTAIVALSGWPTSEPAQDLLEIAREQGNTTHQVLALRGFIDLTQKDSSLDAGKRLQSYRTALDLAANAAEKRRVLSALADVKTPESLELAASQVDDAQVREEAALAAVTIAAELYAGNAETVKPILKRIVAADIGDSTKQQAQKTLDEIEAVESYLVHWEVAGPYAQEGKNHAQLFDIPFGPEQPDSDAQWRKMPVSTSGQQIGYLDLLQELDGGEQCVAYLRTQFESAEAKSATLEIFSDDGVKAWLNGQVVHANNIARPIMPEPDRVNVTLQKGVNKLMLKVTQNNLPWGAIVRVREAKTVESKLGEGFRLHTINADSRFEAAGILDVNRDGKLDIFCGGFWYEAPDWKPHFVREVREEGGYHYDFANLPLDVDGDGWTDIVNAAWHNKMVFWTRNPGKSDRAWELFEVDTPGNMETAMAFDINDDGQLDILPNIMSEAAWYEVHHDASAPQGVRWEKHALPQEAAGHGLGAGDVNADGRCDVVTPRGWLEQTADGWQWRPEFELGHASIPILVHDVDADGDSDIIWGLGHNYGLFWLEQTSDGDQRTWAKHLVDDSWSQPHYMLMADLDNDGKDELVTGKRYHAHNGHDPGGNDPVCVYYYDFDAAAGKWTRHTMHEGGRVAFGINTAVADMDNDGDLDVVAPGKSGLYLFENLLK